MGHTPTQSLQSPPPARDAETLQRPVQEASRSHPAGARRSVHLNAAHTNQVSAEQAGGLSGLVAFLLRLRHAGPRQWIADPANWARSR